MSTLRSYDARTVRLTNNPATSPDIPLYGVAALRLYFPAGYVSTTLQIYDQDPATGNFVQAYNDEGDPLSVTIGAARSVNLPDTIFPAGVIRLTTNADDSARDVGVAMKA